MNFERLLAQGRLRQHSTTKEEIQDILRIAVRDLEDARIPGLSSDRKFFIAYEAALTLAIIPLHCAGYETHGRGHHWMTFLVLPDVMGAEFRDLADYYELCRTKRNLGTYDRGGQISQTETEELISEVNKFHLDVDEWLRSNHPDLV